MAADGWYFDMSSTINATTVGVGGVVTTADNSGILVLQTASTNAITISAAQGVTLAGTLGVTGATTLSNTLAVTGVTTVAAGTALLPALTTTGDTNTGVWFPAADTIAYSTAGSERVRFDSSGKVGIGTTAPLSQLDVAISITDSTLGEATGVGSIKITNGAAALTSVGGLEFKNAGDSNGYGAKIQSLNSGGSQLVFANRNASATWTERARIDSSGNVLVTSAAGLGYGTGSGGTVTQATSKNTDVTLNKPTGQITMNNAALGANSTAQFSCTNSLCANKDTVVTSLSSVGGIPSLNNYQINSYVQNGAIVFGIRNTSAGTLSEAVVFNFAIIKGATA